MKREVRDRWTTALRSGEYPQGVLSFERDGRYCAMGVLCDALGQPRGNNFLGSNWGFVHGLLSDRQKWDVVDRNDGSLTDDGLPMPFADLADWIDANIEVEP